MDKSINKYWKLRLEGLKRSLERNNFEVFLANNSSEAKEIVQKEIFPKTEAKSVAWGGSLTLTETGNLVNLDMYGNRIAAITFGPKYVVIFVGRNKIVQDLEYAMFRIKNYAAPVNSIRLDKKTPCARTSFCKDCKSPDRICNTWTITEKSFPKGRIKVLF